MVEGYGVDAALVERAISGAPVGVTITDPDRPDNPLVYVNDAFTRITGYEREAILGQNCRYLQGEDTDPRAVAELREAIDAREPVTVELLNYRADGEPFWNEVTVAPLTDEAGDLTHFVGFQTDVTARKEAEQALADRTATLEHLVDRIDGLLQDVTAALMQATSRDEGERGVVERIAAADPYVFAWFGVPDRSSDAIVATTWAGTGETVADVAIPFDAEDLTSQAYRSGEIQTGAVEASACADLVPDARSVAATPIAYGDTIYGVLTVYATDDDAFEDEETVVIRALGQTIGTGVNAAQNQRILVADTVIELDLAISGTEFFLTDLTTDTGVTFDHRGSVYNDDTVSMFFEVDDDPRLVSEGAAGVDGVADMRVVYADTDGGLIEMQLVDEGLVRGLTELGGRIQSLTAADGVAELTVAVTEAVEPRAVTERLTDMYPGVEVLAVREGQRRPTTKREFVDRIDDRLTDRQRATLKRAFVSGYYDTPRTTTGEAIADSMGISRSTFHQHLRAAERKLIAEFLSQ
ncbi:MAG: bacterio-opsin activator domain-containing protein [Halobacteriaceae archaeon]